MRMKNYFYNANIVLRVLSIILQVVSFGFIVCIVAAIILKEPIQPFVLSFMITESICLIFRFISRKLNKGYKISRKDSYFIVSISWILVGLLGSLPYLFSHSIPDFTNALFESISGFSTTGASILQDIEVLPKSILFWRSLTHWIGGFGIIGLVIVVMPQITSGGYKLFTMESSLQEKFKPRTRSVGFRILLIYLGLTALEILFLILGGMSLFESVCHSFGTVATGGFSPKNSSIAEYSPYIQYVIMIFMLFAGVNFAMYFYVLSGRVRKIIENEELQMYLLVVFISGLFIGLILYLKTDYNFEHSIRESFFQVISIITCTGFATADYLIWPAQLWILIFFLMFIGGCKGSTAGSIKISRHLVVFKYISALFKQRLNPKSVFKISLNKKTLDEKLISHVLSFVVLYYIVFAFGVLILVFTGVDFQTSLGSVATCMAGIGPGLGETGPVSNFSQLPIASKYVLGFLMILGRLELFTVLILFTRSYRKKF